ncbi:Glyceraldehyde-3-phosphate dehydrogenase [Sciurus carolinensis]|uniref:Glyceraldehyde-3-phosphate dehydrogenase n=1 Tax=Sciurus carolinensis TaxID=30640 RepID=A0AA41MDN4_SCICA|nr:Glyceraldehyde-3-phosphate dehydrogenase [Sciurus carolinensis]
MFQYDSTQDKFSDTVKSENRKLVINGNSISFFRIEIPPTSNGVMLVLNMLWSLLVSSVLGEGQGSFEGQCQVVIISAPSVDAPMFLMCVNRKKYDNSFKIIFLAHLTKVIHNSIGLVEELMITVHAFTATQIMGGPSGKLGCDGYRGAQNIIPVSTRATNALSKVIPEPNGKLTSMPSVCPPTMCQSLI